MEPESSIGSHAEAYLKRHGRLPPVEPPPYDPGGGDGGGSDMEARVRGLEISGAKVEARLDSIDQRLGSIDATLRRIEDRMDKMLTQWDVAKVVGAIMAFAVAAALALPRLAAMLDGLNP